MHIRTPSGLAGLHAPHPSDDLVIHARHILPHRAIRKMLRQDLSRTRQFRQPIGQLLAHHPPNFHSTWRLKPGNPLQAMRHQRLGRLQPISQLFVFLPHRLICHPHWMNLTDRKPAFRLPSHDPIHFLRLHPKCRPLLVSIIPSFPWHIPRRPKRPHPPGHIRMRKTAAKAQAADKSLDGLFNSRLFPLT